jgi:putative tricarboxylic transport membrane protein
MEQLKIIIESFDIVFSYSTIIAIIMGVLWGVIVGALPGLGSIIAITICLPFTYSMAPGTAIALLLSVYCGSVFGGSITAILLNTPGAPQNAATCFDGFPMAQKGMADRALGWASSASVFGGLFSCVVFIVFGPQLARVALKFGPVETFALILMALTCIANVSKGSMLKGLFAGCLGIFLSTVGQDPIIGDMRFVFGIFQIYAGFNLIPVVVGVFALAEVFSRAAGFGQGQATIVKYSGIKFPSIKDWHGRLKCLIKSAAIGSFVGILPGTGAATSAFISYAEARRSSPRSKNFSEGEPDGIIAAETANNAVTGGALVPTLALGIPGDPVTAVMLVTLVLHGITPGVRLMVDNPEMIYSCFIILILANLAMLGTVFPITKGFAKILRTPEPIMMSVVVILCLLGAYGIRLNIFDLYVTLAAGLLGFTMRYLKAAVAPLVIGMVLGQQLEVSLRQGLILNDGNFLNFFVGHPIALSLNLVTCGILLCPLIKYIYQKRKRFN